MSVTVYMESAVPQPARAAVVRLGRYLHSRNVDDDDVRPSVRPESLRVEKSDEMNARAAVTVDQRRGGGVILERPLLVQTGRGGRWMAIKYFRRIKLN